jgi:hypothetical protein
VWDRGEIEEKLKGERRIGSLWVKTPGICDSLVMNMTESLDSSLANTPGSHDSPIYLATESHNFTGIR